MLLGHEAAGIVERVGAAVDRHRRRAARRHDVPAALRRLQRHAPPTVSRRVSRAAPPTARAPCSAGGTRLTRDDGTPVLHHLGVSRRSPPTPSSTDGRSCPSTATCPPVVASLLGCAVLTGGGAVLNAGRPRPGQTVAVVGLGGVGMAAMLTALAHDDVRVVAVDQVADKLDRATDLGAHEAYCAGSTSASSRPTS